MPLAIYKRGRTWWVRGRADGEQSYITRSLRTFDEVVARARVAEIERKARQRAILGPDAPSETDELTFAEATVFYDAKPADAKFLIKLWSEIEHMRVKDITPKFVRDLGKKLYPMASCDT